MALARSPLLRHPRLALRKALNKALRRRARLHFAAPPAGASYACPPELAVGLRRWIERVAPTGPRYPYGRVFGRDFDPVELLALCRKGPPVGGTGLLSDVKLIWEFSRGHDLVLDAAQASDASRESVSSELAGRIRAWVDANGDPEGVNWSCAMEIAIRAVNWISADALLDGALRRCVGPERWDYCLWNHGRAIWSGLEIRLVNSNHYVANLLGLLFLGSVFPHDANGRLWREFARSEMPRALATQTNPDGGLFEASLPYHALVTEMALLHLLLAPSPTVAAIASTMCRIVADMMDTDGDVIRFGDDDSGRVIPLDFLDHTRGRGRNLLALEHIIAGAPCREPGASALYPRSGWWVSRGTRFAAALEFGGVGMAGLGAHAHNDTLSVCAWWSNQPVFVDPGSYLYTGDPAARNAYRSAAAHNTLRFENKEHIELPGGRNQLFELRGSVTPARVIRHEDNNIEVAWSIAGREVRRCVAVTDHGVIVSDSLPGHTTTDVTWTFHCHPDVRVRVDGGAVQLSWAHGPALRLACSRGDARLVVRDGSYAPRYGQQMPSRILEWTLATTLPCDVDFALTEEPLHP